MAEVNENAAAQVSAFSSLVKDGVYSETFQHAPPARAFFKKVMSEVLKKFQSAGKSSIRVMDCGCGNGAWLDFLTDLADKPTIEAVAGFDLTPDMVEVARSRLGKKNLDLNIALAVGDVLNPESYNIGEANRSGHDLIFTFDVIQQLPPKKQFSACELIISQLADDGIAVIFDNDAKSPFGKKMGRKKFITRYLRIPLVPRYYCNAKYPPLQQFADKLAKSTVLDVKIEVSDNRMKRAMIIRKIEMGAMLKN